jgi:hypothetical protein
MRNVLGKSYSENQNTRFSLSSFFENHAVYEIMSKIWCTQRGRNWQYGGALRAVFVTQRTVGIYYTENGILAMPAG